MTKEKRESSKKKEVEREIDTLLAYGGANMSFAAMALADATKRGIDNRRDIDELTR